MNRRSARFIGCLVFSIVLAFHQKSPAAEISVTSKTYLELFEDTGKNRHAPFSEYIELTVKDPKGKTWGFYSAGWFRYELKSRGDENREVDELSYAFLRVAPLHDRSLLIDIGRNLVISGIASEQIDGISARWEVTQSRGFSLFGGRPVETEFDGKRGDLIYGGRVFQRIERMAEFGLSFLREDNDGSRYREEAGFDLWLLPVRKVEVVGQSSYNTGTGGWMEHSYILRVFPREMITLTGLFSRTDYNDAFSARTLSAFSPEFLGKNERVTRGGVSAEYRINRTFTAVLDALHYAYRTMGDAEYYGTRVLAVLSGVAAGISIHRMAGDTERLRYVESRLFAKKNFNSADLSVDAILHHYDVPFNGLDNAYAVNGTFTYKFSSSLMAGLSVDYSKNPDFTHDTKVLLTLAFNVKRN